MQPGYQPKMKKQLQNLNKNASKGALTNDGVGNYHTTGHQAPGADH